ncbi:MAG: hypothetical protein ACPGVK_03600 [Halocynthiibacter sp.]
MKNEKASDPKPEVSVASPKSAEFVNVDNVQDLILAREAEYKTLTKDARQRGLVAGALKGALVGLVIESDPVVVASGAILGGVIGLDSGDRVASNLIQEHKNYLIRRWSLEKVLESAKIDSASTRFDLILSKSLVKSVKNKPRTVASRALIGKLTKFKSHAVSRVVTLREVLPIYEETPAAKRKLEQELSSQLAMISEFQANLATLEELS